MTETTRTYFEGRNREGEYLFTVYPPRLDDSVTDYQLHVLPAELPAQKHDFTDDCWCIPRVEFKGARGSGACWRYTHQPETERHSDVSEQAPMPTEKPETE